MVAENLNVGLPVSRTATRYHAAHAAMVIDHRKGIRYTAILDRTGWFWRSGVSVMVVGSFVWFLVQ